MTAQGSKNRWLLYDYNSTTCFQNVSHPVNVSIPVNILKGADTEIHRNEAVNLSREKGEEQGLTRLKGTCWWGEEEQPQNVCVHVWGVAEKYVCFLKGRICFLLIKPQPLLLSLILLLQGQSRHSAMINNPVLQGDMHSDTIIWREREEPKGTRVSCNLFVSQVCLAEQAVWEPRPTGSCLVAGGVSGEPDKNQTLLA